MLFFSVPCGSLVFGFWFPSGFRVAFSLVCVLCGSGCLVLCLCVVVVCCARLLFVCGPLTRTCLPVPSQRLKNGIRQSVRRNGTGCPRPGEDLLFCVLLSCELARPFARQLVVDLFCCAGVLLPGAMFSFGLWFAHILESRPIPSGLCVSLVGFVF